MYSYFSLPLPAYFFPDAYHRIHSKYTVHKGGHDVVKSTKNKEIKPFRTRHTVCVCVCGAECAHR